MGFKFLDFSAGRREATTAEVIDIKDISREYFSLTLMGNAREGDL